MRAGLELLAPLRARARSPVLRRRPPSPAKYGIARERLSRKLETASSRHKKSLPTVSVEVESKRDLAGYSQIDDFVRFRHVAIPATKNLESLFLHPALHLVIS